MPVFVASKFKTLLSPEMPFPVTCYEDRMFDIDQDISFSRFRNIVSELLFAAFAESIDNSYSHKHKCHTRTKRVGSDVKYANDDGPLYPVPTSNDQQAPTNIMHRAASARHSAHKELFGSAVKYAFDRLKHVRRRHTIIEGLSLFITCRRYISTLTLYWVGLHI